MPVEIDRGNQLLSVGEQLRRKKRRFCPSGEWPPGHHTQIDALALEISQKRNHSYDAAEEAGPCIQDWVHAEIIYLARDCKPPEVFTIYQKTKEAAEEKRQIETPIAA